MPRAVIGIGSNAVRMLTACVCDGALIGVKRYREDVRTFAGLSASGLSEETMARVISAVMRLYETAREDGAELVGLIATSATRDAANADDLAQRIYGGMGIVMNVLTGEEEAQLGFAGATAGQKGRCGMIDIGGGSTELAIGADGETESLISLQLGAARLARDVIISAESKSVEPEAVLAGIEQTLSESRGELPESMPREWVGVGGTFHTLARIGMGGASDVEGIELTQEIVARIADELHRIPLAQRCSVPGLPPRRADIIVPGAWIALACMRALRIQSITVTERGNLDGYLLSAC